ncbi:MAG: DUF4338 domain-containing protein [candidate division NC10 bacterium]|nr:DUF4338 domain-containing protein [candidate division NC10 bacterium]
MDCAALGRTELAYTLCELVDWRRPTGRLKNHEGRLLLEHLEAKGLVTLPPVRALGRRGPRDAPRSPQGAPAPDVVGAIRDVLPLALEIVPPGRTGPSRLWRELIGRYHYLGDRVPVGATLRYFVRPAQQPEQLLACLGWTSAAWRIAVRDRWIGWSDAQRRQNLPYLVNHSRFLILPWIHLKGLASHILGLCARHLPPDWEARYGVRPLLLETLVDPARFRGTCYRAANWLPLGQTAGRGRMDRANVLAGHAPKAVYVYPLCRDVQARLCRAPAPARAASGEAPDGP